MGQADGPEVEGKEGGQGQPIKEQAGGGVVGQLSVVDRGDGGVEVGQGEGQGEDQHINQPAGQGDESQGGGLYGYGFSPGRGDRGGVRVCQSNVAGFWTSPQLLLAKNLLHRAGKARHHTFAAQGVAFVQGFGRAVRVVDDDEALPGIDHPHQSHFYPMFTIIVDESVHYFD